MKKALFLFFLMLIAGMLNFSLSFAEWGNYATPQLEWISNALPGLWDRPKEDLLRIMDIFPDFSCTDYGDQVSCQSKYNRDKCNIFIVYFLDDYESKHDNLWKASFTIDLQSSDQEQDLFALLWLKGLKPAHLSKERTGDIYSYPEVIPSCFKNETTSMVAYFQTFGHDSYPFFLVEYYAAQ